MEQPLVYMLLVLALLLPIGGAAVLRVLAPRLSLRAGIGAASAIFGLAIVSVLVLGRSDVGRLQFGELTLLLPVTSPSSPPQLITPPAPPSAPPVEATSEPAATPTARPSASPIATATSTRAATAAPTEAPTEVPTEAPTEAPTEVPTEAPTEAPAEAPAPAQQIYVVQPGDTLRGIAEQFEVSVEDLLAANGLSPEDADALRPGQELVIP
jgi:LysM repeat protein